MPKNIQIDLFEHVAGAYTQPVSEKLTNEELYRIVAGRAGICPEILNAKSPIGNDGKERSTVKRSIRWAQQSLRKIGIIEKVDGERAVWQLTKEGKSKLRKIRDNIAVIGFSTNLGVAIWSNCKTVFDNINEPIFAVISSPPYPLKIPRAYGNPPLEEYLDFICYTLEPIVKNLVSGGNIVLSLGDVYEDHSPAKSTYIEELIITLRKKLGLSLMNKIIWESNKPPGPIAWASKKRMQLNEAYEYCLWFCNEPINCIANNQRILEPHTEKHQKLINAGGEKRESVNGDGAYRLHHGSYGNITAGRIPRNIFHISNVCQSQRQYKARARELGLTPHGAAMPLSLAQKLVKFLTESENLIADPFAGSMTTPLASELEGRRWIATDNIFDYVRGGAERFRNFEGFELNINT